MLFSVLFLNDPLKKFAVEVYIWKYKNFQVKRSFIFKENSYNHDCRINYSEQHAKFYKAYISSQTSNPLKEYFTLYQKDCKKSFP